MPVLSDLISSPAIWDVIQRALSAPDFKKQLYSAVLGPSGRLLDFGCADGHIADVFLRYEYYGLDQYPSTIKRAAEVSRAHANMHFPDERQLPDVLVEMQRLLKPGGTIHIVEPVRQASDGWQPRLLRWLDQGKHPRNLRQIKEAVQATNGLEPGIATLHRPYGALIQDCDFVHLPVRKVE